MAKPISKFFRFLRREHPAKTAFLVPSTAAGIGIGILTIATGGATAPLLIIPAAGGFFGMIFGGIGDAHFTGNAESVSGCMLVGEPKDIYRVRSVQKRINQLTKKLQHMDKLPEKVQRKVMAHVGDAEEALARLRVYEGHGGGRQPASFSFYREYYDEAGRYTTQVLAVVDLKKENAAAASSPAPSKQAPSHTDGRPSAPETTPEFNSLSKKIEKLEGRLKEIENPKPAALDKPKAPKNPEL